MKTTTGIALVLASAAAFAAAPAYAQESKTPMQIIDEGRKNERLQVEKQYDAMKQSERPTATKSGKRDPWAGARSSDVVTGASDKPLSSTTPRREAKKVSKPAGKPMKLH